MKKHAMAALLAVVGLTLASCGGSAGGGDQGDMQGMDHGGSGGDARSSRQAAQETTGGGMAGMDHAKMDHGPTGGEETARRMLEDENGEYSDKRFIDMMVPHHEGAVEMAEVALEKSDREEILDLSRDIVRTQNAEVGELRDIKEQEFGTSEIPMGMTEGEMRGMGMAMDAEELGRQRPFDRAFIDNMIPHHESAVDMANVALEESDNPRISELATGIVEAQEREIAQMEGWREEWYPEG
ncbi:MAG: hypothetical protein AVDCRST_MAG12-3441 [uncultured Rubrobacteraceae bacterium]|uniref:DUF305 domain-containing protein n=1 Tax=uncultured Rubrobacteraceae bacterium TaxID=349277 RepID=A0A6J4T7C3_9ACTN|nr:MAG: hypothetical protein AVDCRST_MAG12-3441 [uncultured Rubrobacteraceae bacterium]